MDKKTAQNIILAIQAFHHSIYIGATEDEASLLAFSLLVDDKETYEKLTDKTLDTIKKRALEQAKESIKEQFLYEVKKDIEKLRSMGCKGTITYKGEKMKL